MAAPDFICIGAQKAGTGWLYDQLRAHPDFWMPPLKELHYFDRAQQLRESSVARTLPYARTPADRLEIARERSRDDRDRKFVAEIQRLYGQAGLDLAGYGHLFETKDKLISGDITPGYSTLPEETIAQIVGAFPKLKVTFLARDPVERVWSQLSMYVRRELIAPFDVNDLEQVTLNIQRPEIAERSYPTEIVNRWRRHVPAKLFGTYFFDDLRNDAGATRRAIISFLGGNPDKQSGELAPDYNVKARKEKLPLPDATRLHLARLFESELRACATQLGGSAKNWPARYSL